MKIFLDTSSLIKLYHYETGTDYLDSLFEKFDITEIFLSELSKIEFSSAVMKKVRTKDLRLEDAISLIESFENDFGNYSFIKIDSKIVDSSKELIYKYGAKGLRALDSIQLASMLELKDEIDFILTTDKLLENLATIEGIEVK